MSYQVLARKWRPKSFETLVGQDPGSLTVPGELHRHSRLLDHHVRYGRNLHQTCARDGRNEVRHVWRRQRAGRVPRAG